MPHQRMRLSVSHQRSTRAFSAKATIAIPGTPAHSGVQLPSWREPPSASVSVHTVAWWRQHQSIRRAVNITAAACIYLCGMVGRQHWLPLYITVSVPSSDLSPTISKISKNIEVKALYICGEDQGWPSGSNHCYSNDMSKHASLYELSTPLTTLDTTKVEKNSSSHVWGSAVEADAYISGRHMLPLRWLQREPRFIVEMKVSYSVHVSSRPYRNHSKRCSPQSLG
ncbi:hypothetical protein HDV64DRAFT_79294 [Trichoderma sp. TUCIM 5745]